MGYSRSIRHEDALRNTAVHVQRRESVCIGALYKLAPSVPERIGFFDFGVKIGTDKVMLGKIGGATWVTSPRPTTRELYGDARQELCGRRCILSHQQICFAYNHLIPDQPVSLRSTNLFSQCSHPMKFITQSVADSPTSYR